MLCKCLIREYFQLIQERQVDFVVTESEKYNCFYGGLVTLLGLKVQKKYFRTLVAV